MQIYQQPLNPVLQPYSQLQYSEQYYSNQPVHAHFQQQHPSNILIQSSIHQPVQSPPQSYHPGQSYNVSVFGNHSPAFSNVSPQPQVMQQQETYCIQQPGQACYEMQQLPGPVYYPPMQSYQQGQFILHPNNQQQGR
jgi:hypothetical protein